MTGRENLSFQHNDEEEFHITDEDIDRELAAMDAGQPDAENENLQEVVSEKPLAKKGRFLALKQLKRKHWVIIIIIVVILLLGLLKMIGNSQSSASLDSIAPAEIPKKSISLPEISKKVPEANVVSSPSSQDLPSISISPVKNNAADLMPSGLSNANAMTNNADAKLAEMLRTIEQQNQQLQQQVTLLSQRVVGLESNLNRPVQAANAPSIPMMSSTPSTLLSARVTPSSSFTLPPEPEYTVEAVVPQRAWIQNGNGTTLTLTVGDDVPGLGAVTAIDPYSGNVTTASGTVIKYAN